MATLDIKTAIEKSPNNDDKTNIILKIFNKDDGAVDISIAGSQYHSIRYGTKDIAYCSSNITYDNTTNFTIPSKTLAEITLSYNVCEMSEGDILEMIFNNSKLVMMRVVKEEIYELDRLSDEEVVRIKKENLKLLEQKVERLEALEEKCGISIENISFTECANEQILSIFSKPINNSTACFVEVISPNGAISDNVKINAIVYDNEGNVLCRETDSLDADKFAGFDVVELKFYGIKYTSIGKIRIYPTK